MYLLIFLTLCCTCSGENLLIAGLDDDGMTHPPKHFSFALTSRFSGARPFGQEFEQTAAYLTAIVGSRYNLTFRTQAYPFNELQTLVHQQKAAFIIAHASVFSCLESADSVTSLATVQRLKRGQSLRGYEHLTTDDDMLQEFPCPMLVGSS
jgi:hypothetical protein